MIHNMTFPEVVEYLENEAECVRRGSTCSRDCGNCELVRKDEDILEAYRIAIGVMKEKIREQELLKEWKDGNS